MPEDRAPAAGPGQSSPSLDPLREAGRSALVRRDFSVAIHQFRSIQVLVPTDEEAAVSLAQCFLALGEWSDAREQLVATSGINPYNGPVWSHLGLCYLQSRQLADGATAFQRAISLGEQTSANHHNLGICLQGIGQDEAAATAFRAAAKLDPASPLNYLYLGNIMFKHGLLAESIKQFRRTLRLQPHQPAATVQLARALSQSGDESSAREIFEKNYRDSSEVATGYGFWLQEAGDFEASRTVLRLALDKNPSDGQALFGLVQGKRVTEADAELIAEMKTTLSAQKLSLRARAYLHYALGKCTDQQSDFASAFEHYHSANRIADELHSTTERFRQFDFEADIDLVNQQCERFKHINPSLSAKPIFIVGMIRSGTTLMEQILGAHRSILPAGELRFWLEEGPACESLRADRDVASRYLEYIEAIGPDSERVTDKMPLNYRWVGLMHRAFPNAKFIHVKRHPADTCLSIYMTPFSTPPEFAHVPEHIAKAYRHYQQIMSVWDRDLRPDRLFTMKYEDLISDREPVLRQLLQFLELDWDDQCLRHNESTRAIHTPSLWQARQPIYSSSKERWRNYEGWIEPFLSIPYH